MTGARTKAIQAKVNSFLAMCEITLFESLALCVPRYEPHDLLQTSMVTEDEEGQDTDQEETKETKSDVRTVQRLAKSSDLEGIEDGSYYQKLPKQTCAMN
jgi:hypothetical protein